MAMRGWSEDEIRTVARMYANGELFKSIGEAIHKSADTVNHYVRAHPERFISDAERRDVLQGKGAALYIPRYTRRCHDCGRPTTDYRCPWCWARLRSRGGYAPKGDASDMDTVTYGPVQ